LPFLGKRVVDLQQPLTRVLRPITGSFLLVMTLLTASRGAIIALLGALLVFFVFSPRSATKVSSIFVTIAATGGFYYLMGSDLLIIERFADSSVQSFGEREPIWETALHVALQTGSNLFIGVGTGGADKIIAHNSTMLWAEIGADNIPRTFAHNTFVEWGLTLGVVGIFLGVLLARRMLLTAWRLDCRDGVFFRLSLLAYCALVSGSTCLHRTSLWPACGSLLWAALSDREQREEIPKKAGGREGNGGPLPEVWTRVRTG